MLWLSTDIREKSARVSPMGKTLHLQVIYKVKLNACAFISVRRLKLDQQIQNAHFSVLLFFSSSTEQWSVADVKCHAISHSSGRAPGALGSSGRLLLLNNTAEEVHPGTHTQHMLVETDWVKVVFLFFHLGDFNPVSGGLHLSYFLNLTSVSSVTFTFRSFRSLHEYIHYLADNLYMSSIFLATV